MANLNEHTGATLRTKVPNDAYKDGWDRIFGRSQTEDKCSQDEGKEKQGE